MFEVESVEPSNYGEEKRYFCEQEGQTCEVYYGLKEVPKEWIEALWDAYDESLHIEEAIQEQACFTRESFISALKDPEYNKIVMTVDGVIAGFLMGTTNLEKARIGYINPRFTQDRFPQEVEERRFWYMPCFFAASHVRHLGFIKMMVLAAIDAIRENKYVLALDVSNSRMYVSDMLVKLGEEAGFPIEKLLLGSQTYFAYRPVLDRESCKIEEVKP